MPPFCTATVTPWPKLTKGEPKVNCNASGPPSYSPAPSSSPWRSEGRCLGILLL